MYRDVSSVDAGRRFGMKPQDRTAGPEGPGCTEIPAGTTRSMQVAGQQRLFTPAQGPRGGNPRKPHPFTDVKIGISSSIYQHPSDGIRHIKGL
jgi:hypothetical protein